VNRCPSCGGEKIAGVEYAYGSTERYDGVSEWMCQSCGLRVGRWTGEYLNENEVESRYGNRGVVLIDREPSDAELAGRHVRPIESNFDGDDQ
jgi:hypothetical protein